MKRAAQFLIALLLAGCAPPPASAPRTRAKHDDTVCSSCDGDDEVPFYSEDDWATVDGRADGEKEWTVLVWLATHVGDKPALVIRLGQSAAVMALRGPDGVPRTAPATPTRLRRETRTAGPSAITSASAPSRRARRPARRSAARVEGARTVTCCPSRRSPAATPATCSFTSCG